MHESRLVADLVARASAVVPTGTTSVESVSLELLPGSHLDAPTLRSQFEAWAAGTRIEGAEVVIETAAREAPGDVVLVSVTVRS